MKIRHAILAIALLAGGLVTVQAQAQAPAPSAATDPKSRIRELDDRRIYLQAVDDEVARLLVPIRQSVQIASDRMVNPEVRGVTQVQAQTEFLANLKKIEDLQIQVYGGERVALFATPAEDRIVHVEVPRLAEIRDKNREWNYRVFYLKAQAALEGIGAFRTKIAAEQQQIQRDILNFKPN